MANYFDGQHENEEVILVFRRHPIVMRKGFYLMLGAFLVASIPVLIWPENLNYLWVALGGLGLGLLLFFYHWMGWYFSIFIVTNIRLRQMTQKGFFNRSVIDVGISKIQNISYNIPGFNAAMFGFGNIIIQTYVGDLCLDRIHRPLNIYNNLQRIVQDHGSLNESHNYEEAIE